MGFLLGTLAVLAPIGPLPPNAGRKFQVSEKLLTLSGNVSASQDASLYSTPASWSKHDKTLKPAFNFPQDAHSLGQKILISPPSSIYILERASKKGS